MHNALEAHALDEQGINDITSTSVAGSCSVWKGGAGICFLETMR
jgi:hypothetical protein